MKRRAVVVVAVLAVSAWLVLGTASIASAATVTGTVGAFSASADDSNPAAGAQITGYTGGAAVVIPATITLGAIPHTYTVTSIANAVFESKGITSVSFPSTITSIGDAAFNGNINLTGVTLPASLTSIGQGAFAQTDLVSITIPNGVTEIQFAAFDGADLTSVNFGTGVTTLDVGAFNNNDFTDLTIPTSITSIGDQAFGQDSSLTHVAFEGAAPTTFTALGASGSFGPGPGPTINYRWRFGSTAIPAGAFTTPTWEGYNTIPIVRVSFDMDGHGAAVADSEFPSGDAPTQPADPTTTGRTFLGWFTNASLTTPFDFATTQTTDQVAFAGWSGLAETGVAIPPYVIPTAIGVVVLGVALMLIGLLLRRRRTRADSPES